MTEKDSELARILNERKLNTRKTALVADAKRAREKMELCALFDSEDADARYASAQATYITDVGPKLEDHALADIDRQDGLRKQRDAASAVIMEAGRKTTEEVIRRATPLRDRDPSRSANDMAHELAKQITKANEEPLSSSRIRRILGEAGFARPYRRRAH